MNAITLAREARWLTMQLTLPLWESDFTVQSQTTIIRTYEVISIGIRLTLEIEMVYAYP